MTMFRRNSIEGFNENRTLARFQFEANMSRIRTTFLEGKLQAAKDCMAQAAPVPRNASGPHSGVFGGCMRAALAALRTTAQADRQANTTAWSGMAGSWRTNAKAQFEADRDAWLAANPKPS
jgi:hypothetical protein